MSISLRGRSITPNPICCSRVDSGAISRGSTGCLVAKRTLGGLTRNSALTRRCNLLLAPLRRWQTGYAADLKSAQGGSIPSFLGGGVAECHGGGL